MLGSLLGALVSGTLALLGPIIAIPNRILFESGGSPITILQTFLGI
ncbi:MAG: hypothetical protein ACT4QF_00710 [Sporichthyaceae bacterium]|jgi:hypothetical protein